MINIIKILIVMGPLLFFSKVEGAAAAADPTAVEDPDGITRVKGVFTRLSEGPLPDVIVDEGALSTFQFKANLCRELSSFFGRQHLRIEETADPSAALLAVKFTFTVAGVAAGAVIPGAGTFLVPGGTGEAIVTALSDELKTQVTGLIASVPERDLLRTGGGGFFFTTTFGEIDQLCRIISTEITDIYRPFIERLESKSAISFAKVAGKIIKYYVGSQSLFEGRIGGKYTTPSELVLAVAQFHPLSRYMGIGLFNKTKPYRNSLELKIRGSRQAVWALDILQGSRIQVGAGTYRSTSVDYNYFNRPWNENGIVYTKAPDRHDVLRAAFGAPLVRTATGEYKDTLGFV